MARVKKYFWIAAGILLTALAAVYAYRYYLLNRKSELAAFIPAHAHSVVYLNTRSLWKHLQQGDSQKRLISGWKDNPYLARLESLSETGIDLLSDAALIELNGFHYFTVLLQNRMEFEKALQKTNDSLFGQTVKLGAYSKVYSLKDSFLLLWSDRSLVLIPRNEIQKCKQPPEQLLQSDPNKGFHQTEIYRQVHNDTVPVWFYSKEKQIRNHVFRNLKGVLTLGGGIRIMAVESIRQPLSWQEFPAEIPDSLTFLYADTALPVLNRLIRELAILQLGASHDEIAQVDFSNTQKMLMSGGMETIESQSVTYVYDEDFNRTARIVVRKDSIQTAALLYRSEKNSPYRILHNSKKALQFPRPVFAPSLQCFLSFDQKLFHGFAFPGLQFSAKLMMQERGKMKYWQLEINNIRRNKSPLKAE